MKDLFSGHAGEYARYRPEYPQDLYDLILEKVDNRESAWDVATGNGQVAKVLAKRFKHVYATDISQEQLAEAPGMDNIGYSVSSAEDSGLENNSVDLITVAQALHWFDFDNFYREVNRVARPGAHIAVWGYGLFSVSETVDRLIHHFYHKVVGPYWEEERNYVDQAYKNVPFPFTATERHLFMIRQQWKLQDMVGYLQTWSSVKKYIGDKGEDPVNNLLQGGLAELWPEEEVKSVLFPVFLLMGKVS